jgi:hypothetical protein
MRAFTEMPEDRRRLVCEQAGAQSGLFDSSVEKDLGVLDAGKTLQPARAR